MLLKSLPLMGTSEINTTEICNKKATRVTAHNIKWKVVPRINTSKCKKVLNISNLI